MKMDEFNKNLPIKFMIVLGKMHASILSKVDMHIKEMGLNNTEFLILYAIASNGKLTIQDIAARISMTSGNMTYTIDKLEKRNLVKRVRHESDRRRIFIDFTDEGLALWDSVMTEHLAFMEQAFEDLDDDLIKATVQNMKIIGNLFADKL